MDNTTHETPRSTTCPAEGPTNRARPSSATACRGDRAALLRRLALAAGGGGSPVPQEFRDGFDSAWAGNRPG